MFEAIEIKNLSLKTFGLSKDNCGKWCIIFLELVISI